VSDTARARLAVAALGAILAITASWWALALWPVDAGAPEWFLRTREVCFGSTEDGLPNAGGWLLLVGQPIGMVAVLALVWWAELRAGMSQVMARVAGQLTIGTAAALLVVGVWSAGGRVRTAGLEPFSIGDADVVKQLTRVHDMPPALTLTDQSGRKVSLAAFRGRPVLVTFAYAHCETVCPLIVSDVLGARQQAADVAPVVLIITLDPWRDTPRRLPTIARQWMIEEQAHVLSGDPEAVERALNAWRVPRTRNGKTGEIVHPSVVYVIDAEGRIAYVVSGGARTIAAAVRSLDAESR
jgi:cytochrome oxidase Cu insertion factor (SCO1/SenC/PrrC family)